MNRLARMTAAALLAAALFLAAGYPGARAEDAPSLQRILSDRYSAMRIAMDERAIDKVREMLAPGFTSVSLSGRIEDAAQMLKMMESRPEGARPYIATTGVKILKEEEGKTLVSQIYEMKAVKMGRDRGQDRVHIIAQSTDTWVKQDGRWLLERTVTDSADLYVNDKIEKHRVRGGAAPAAGSAPAMNPAPAPAP
jgi:hypothetical protein